MKVLIVDDNHDIVESTKMLLEMEGFEVVTLTTSQEILDTIRGEDPDVVLQDISMPGLDLPQLLQALRSQEDIGDTRVLLFTANLGDADRWQEWGADGLVAKPFEMDDLLAAIASSGPVDTSKKD